MSDVKQSDVHEQLLGYLMGALEEDERRQVEEQLKDSPALRSKLQRMRDSLRPLAEDRQPIRPPRGLWQRTCRLVDVTSQVIPGGTLRRVSNWRLKDMAAAAVILIAVCLVLFPAVHRSQFDAAVTGCQNKLRGLGLALHQYSENHAGRFPQVPREGNAAFVGTYAAILRDYGLLPEPNMILCPAVAPSRDRELIIPTMEQLRQSQGLQLVRLRRAMTGDYGFTLGFRTNGRYMPVKNLRRSDFPIMADAPGPALDGQPSSNHGGQGQNLLFETGNVRFVRVREPTTGLDYYFLNDDGQVAPGRHWQDAVIGPSHARPAMWPR